MRLAVSLWQPPTGPGFALLFTLAVFPGCAGPRTTAAPHVLPAGFPHHSARMIGDLLQATTDTLSAFRTVSRAAIASPDGSSRFTARIFQRREDSVRIDIRVQLGIEAARILFTPDSVFVYDRIKKIVYYGDTENAERLLPVPWKSPDLFLDILGLPDIEIDDSWSVAADSLRYYLTSADGLQKVIVDPGLWRIVRSEIRDEQGRLREERTFLDFDRFQGVPLPRRIVVRRPLDRISATVSHRSITLNPTHLDLGFEVPTDVRYEPIR